MPVKVRFSDSSPSEGAVLSELDASDLSFPGCKRAVDRSKILNLNRIVSIGGCNFSDVRRGAHPNVE